MTKLFVIGYVAGKISRMVYDMICFLLSRAQIVFMRLNSQFHSSIQPRTLNPKSAGIYYDAPKLLPCKASIRHAVSHLNASLPY